MIMLTAHCYNYTKVRILVNRIHLVIRRYGSLLQNVHGLPIVHNEGYVCQLPPKHRFPMQKFSILFRILIEDRVIDPKKQVVEPEQVTSELVTLVHSSEYVNKFFEGKTTPAEQRVTGFQWTPELASRVRFETGGTLLASRIALERGLCCSTAGGTHHAFPSHGAGYCLINDLGVAARYAKEKVLIVDLDVHQGDGTAFIFKDDPNVFTLSMHCDKNYPVRKQDSDLDIGLDKNVEDKEYLKVLAEHLPHVLDTFKPSLILYDAGVDPHEADELGKLKLTDQGLFKRDEYVLKEAINRGVPVAAVIGGGYDSDVYKLAKRHSILHRASSKVWKDKQL